VLFADVIANVIEFDPHIAEEFDQFEVTGVNRP